MSADLATLAIRVDSAQASMAVEHFEHTTSHAVLSVEAFEHSVEKVEHGLSKFRTVLGLGLFAAEFVHASIEAQNSMAQLEAGVKSTGASAGFTAEQLREQAFALEEVSTFTHVAIEETQGILLLFQKLKGTQFTDATQAVADLATRMRTDMPTAARALGKAMEDPTVGLMALRRAGILFTDSQKEQLATLVRSGHQVEAQAGILDLFKTKLGGSALAARETLGGALKAVMHEFENLTEVTRTQSGGIITILDMIAHGMAKVRETAGLMSAAVAAFITGFAIDKLSGIVSALNAQVVAHTRVRAAAIASATAEADATAVRLALASQTNLSAQIEVVAANAEMREAKQAMTAATVRQTAAIEAENVALIELTDANLAAAAAEETLAKAETHVSAATVVATGALSKLNGALALVGGPVGLAIIGAVLAVRHAFHEEAKGAEEAHKELEHYEGAVTGLTLKQRELQKEALETSVAMQKTKVADIAKEITTAMDAGKGGGGFDTEKIKTLNEENNKANEILTRLIAMLKITEESLKGEGDATETAGQKAKDYIEQKESEIAKLRGLNAAYGQSALALKLLDIQLSANIEKTKAHKDTLTKDWEAIDKSIDAMTAQQSAAAKLAFAKQAHQDLTAAGADSETSLRGAESAGKLAEATDRVSQAQLLNAEAARSAQLELEHLKNAQEAEATAFAAEIELRKSTVGATDQEIRAAIALYDSKVNTANALRRERDAQADASAKRKRAIDLTKEQYDLDKEYAAWKDAEFDRQLKSMEVQSKQAEDAKARALSFVEDFYRSASQGAMGFWDFFKQQAERAFAELATKKLMEKLMSVDAIAGLFQEKGGTPAGFDPSTDASEAVMSPEMIAKLHPQSSLAKMAAGAGQAIGMVGTAWQVGGMLGGLTTNKWGGAALGALGGAGAGAAMGATMGGPIGAVAGGIIGAGAGLVSGFFSAKHSAEDAAKALKQMEMNAAQVRQSLADWRAQITGTAEDQRAANEADLRWKYLSLIQTIEQVEAGKKMEAQREKDLKEAADLYAMAQKQLTDTTNDLNDAFSGMINAVQGYKLNLALFNYSPALGPTTTSGGAGSGGGSGGGGGGGGSGGGGSGGGHGFEEGDNKNIVVQLVLDGKVIAKSTVDQFRKVSQRTFGSSDKIAESMALI